jgi:hypothetical protein
MNVSRLAPRQLVNYPAAISLTPPAKFMVHDCWDETNGALLQQVEPILANLWQQHARDAFIIMLRVVCVACRLS